MVEQADTSDLKSDTIKVCRFESYLGHCHHQANSGDKPYQDGDSLCTRMSCGKRYCNTRYPVILLVVWRGTGPVPELAYGLDLKSGVCGFDSHQGY